MTLEVLSAAAGDPAPAAGAEGERGAGVRSRRQRLVRSTGIRAWQPSRRTVPSMRP